jgi:hypothetical protein
MGFVWPVNCHFVCVIVRTNIEMPTLIPGFLRAAAPEQIPDLSLAFIESLHAASKVSQEIDSTPHCVSKAAQRQRSTSENAKASNEVPVYRAVSSPVLSKQTVLSQLVLQPQQTPSTNSVVNPTQLPHTVGFVSSDTSIGSIIAQAGVDSSDSVQLSRTPGSNDLLQTAPMLSGSIVERLTPSIMPSPRTWKSISNVGVTLASNKSHNSIQSAVPNAGPNGVQNPLPRVTLSGISSTVPNTSSSEAGPSTVQSEAPSAATDGVRKPLPGTVLNAAQSANPNTSSTNPSAATNVVANAGSNTVPSTVHKADANSVQKSIPNVVLNAVSNVPLSADPVSVLRTALKASAMGVAASSLSTVSTAQAMPSTAATDTSVFPTGLSVPGATTDQLVALTQQEGRLPQAGQAGVSSLVSASLARPSAIAAADGMDRSKGATNDATRLKQPAQPSGDKTGYQGATPSGDQTRGGASSQGQCATPTQMIVENHSVNASTLAQDTSNAAHIQAAPIQAVLIGHTEKAADNAPSAATPAPLALPVINAARLIQSMGQSEIRVGMRSTEFGNISISTSTTRDVISAQISLDHGELAKALATHLPEMQARLGGNQPMDIRIDMNMQGPGQGAETSSSMSNGSAAQSRGGRQQAGDANPSYSGNEVAEHQFLPVMAPMTKGNGGLNTRLDIRV